jgi:hypothetical protein
MAVISLAGQSTRSEPASKQKRLPVAPPDTADALKIDIPEPGGVLFPSKEFSPAEFFVLKPMIIFEVLDNNYWTILTFELQIVVRHKDAKYGSLTACSDKS